MESQSPCVITKKTYEIMKYIYRHKEVTIQTIDDRFGEDAFLHAFYLCKNKYAAYRDDQTDFTYNATSLLSDGTIALTLDGEKYVEDKLSSFIRWVIPTVISILALAISCFALLSSLGTTEVFVHLVK